MTYHLHNKNGTIVGTYQSMRRAMSARDRKDRAYGAIIGLYITKVA